MFDTIFRDKDYTDKLEYANPYIGLKELYTSGKIHASKIQPILLRPQVSAQVFVHEPTRLAPRGEHDYNIPMQGMLSPNERHLHVTPKTHTIVQFRTIDYGMEDCHLVFTLPALDTALEDHASFTMHPASRFDIFRLTTKRPVDMKVLSYSSKPQMAEKVATLQPRLDGDTLIHRFPCVWGTLHVFEIACADTSECLLDTWSSQNTTYGVNIYQHQTV
ncbi:hypothetical protein C8Q80DRAFT_1111114 [Daedaleopsis nitida]|nr:hypothetical protein C8Q80DRAFT_1111114 [Daedaleopsis nitida]